MTDNKSYDVYSLSSPNKTLSSINYNPSFPFSQTNNFSPLPQFDGNITDLSCPNSPAKYPSPTSLYVPAGSTALGGFRQTTYVMNKTKQLRKLSSDARRSDYEVKISPNNENVNVECSTGFYAQVAIPSLRSIKIGQTESEAGILVECKDIVGKIDAKGSGVNTVLHFRLYQDKLCVGGVAVHLHHSTRMIQVQGSSVLPDMSHAPVWFVENYIKPKLSLLSASKATDVSSFNQKVQQMVASSLKSAKEAICGGCKAPFNGRSVPELCKSCSKYYHKFKCFSTSAHSCYTRSRARSCSTLPAASQPSLPLNPPLHSINIPTLPSLDQLSRSTSTNLTTRPPTPHTDPLHNPVSYSTTTSAPPSTQPMITQSSSHTDTPAPSPPDPVPEPVLLPPLALLENITTYPNAPTPTSNLNPSAPPFNSNQDRAAPSETQPGAAASSGSPPAASTGSQPGASTGAPPGSQAAPSSGSQPAPAKPSGRGKKSKQLPATDPQGLEHEFTKYALNTAKAKICEQETQMNDLKFRNEILEQRIASLEKRQKDAISEEILYPQSDRHIPCCRAVHCCSPGLPVHCSRTAAASTPHPSDSDNKKLDKVITDIATHAKLLDELIRKLDSLPACPTSSATASNTNQPPPPSHSRPPEQASQSPTTEQSPDQDTSAVSIDYAMDDVSLSDDSLNS